MSSTGTDGTGAPLLPQGVAPGTVLDVLGEGVVVQDFEGHYVMANASATRLLGVTLAELLERSALDPRWSCVHEDGTPWPGYDQPAMRVLRTGEPEGPHIMGVHRTDGSFAWLEVRSDPVFGGMGYVGHVVTGLLDVTDRLDALRRATENERRHAEVARHLDGVMRAATDHAIIATDLSGTVTTFNVGAERLLGRPAQEVVGRVRLVAFHDLPEVRARAAELGVEPGLDVFTAAARAGGSDTRDWTWVHSSGARMQVSLTVTAMRQDGELTGYIAIATDVTRQRRTVVELAEAKGFRRMFDEAPTGVLSHDDSGTVTAVNAALCTILGRRPEELVGRDVRELATSLHGGSADPLAFTALDSENGRSSSELTVVRPDGAVAALSVESVLLPGMGGQPPSGLVHVQDVSEERRFQAQLAHLADHDPLTDLLNRRGFEAALEEHLQRTERYGPDGALMIMDLDHFKAVNDSLGHDVGDQLIISTAQELRRRLRTSDVVARLGGDEFAVLLPTVEDPWRVEAVAADIIDSVRERVSVLDGSRRRSVTASLGVVLINKPGLSRVDLMSHADLTMYDAKEAGRDRYSLLDLTRNVSSRFSARLAWADRIEMALEQGRMVLHAQPILDLRSGVVDSAEVLLRLVDEEGGLVQPSRFLYIAERLGLMTRIDSWVAAESVRLLEELQQRFPGFRLEVNLSGLSMGDDTVREAIRHHISGADIDPSGLVFEITETAAVADVHAAREFAADLQSLGCRFALDDFGAGFGSFYYLKHLPFDYLKIDGEFIAKCASSATDRLILDSIVGIAKGMEKETIAEFVGDRLTLDTVRRHGVDHAQGYEVGRPLPLSNLLANLDEGFSWLAG